MNIKQFPLKDIHPYERNPRKNDKAAEAVAESIKQYGFLVPLVISTDHEIITGHTRYKAAKRLGLKEVPCIRADDLTDEQIKAFRLADNKTAEFSAWDIDLLKDELDGLLDIDMGDFGFNLDIAPENTSREVDPSQYGDEEFKHQCPKCGFRYNDE